MRLSLQILMMTVTFSAALAQDAAGGAPVGGAPASPTVGGGNNSSGNVGNTRTRQDPNENPINRRPIFLSGIVTLPDGSPPPSSAKIERVCYANARVEGNTDSKGRFHFEVGRNIEIQDASVGGGNFDPSGAAGNSRPGGFGNGNSSGGFGGLGGGGFQSAENMLMGCELRASLGGFRSSTIQLVNVRPMDNPDVGVIILMPMGKVEGLTVSATTALAPKDARKAYEKGLDGIKKKNLADAQANFEKATSIYPKHAAAWFELGRLLERGGKLEEANKAYEQSIAADGKYVAPRDQVAWIQFRQADWEKVLESSAQIIRLNPFEFTDAFYMSSVANFQLKKWDAAEKDARDTLKLDLNKKFQRAHYLLGLTLAQKGEFAASAASLKAFLAAEPKADDAPQIRKQLEQVETAFKEKAKP